MYSSAYYKLEARKTLKGNFRAAFLASVIFMIPTYLMSLIDSLFVYFPQFEKWYSLSILINIIVSVFVINILYVGYYRFILSLKKDDEKNVDYDEKKYDYNLVVSGFTANYKNTLKITFLANLYLFGWGLFALIPAMLFVGLVAYLAATTDIISTIYSMMMQLTISPSPDMLNNFSDYVINNCPYLPIASTLSFLLTIPAVIPLIRKYYEYITIPMIVADDADITAKNAFKRTKDIMTGYKFRYFILQLSFILYVMGAGIVFAISRSMLVYYIAIILLQPYVTASFLAFYKERKNIVDYNTSVYDQH